MAIPRVQIPTLRAFLGAIALTKTTAVTALRGLYKLQGGLTQNDTDVRDVVNAVIDAFDAFTLASPGAIGGTTPAAGTFTTIQYSGSVKGIDGGVPNFGLANVTHSDAADYTLPSSQTGSHILIVSGLTANRNLILPLVAGAYYRIKNLTAWTITAKGATGTGILVAGGSVTSVYCDGTNYLQA